MNHHPSPLSRMFIFLQPASIPHKGFFCGASTPAHIIGRVILRHLEGKEIFFLWLSSELDINITVGDTLVNPTERKTIHSYYLTHKNIIGRFHVSAILGFVEMTIHLCLLTIQERDHAKWACSSRQHHNRPKLQVLFCRSRNWKGCSREMKRLLSFLIHDNNDKNRLLWCESKLIDTKLELRLHCWLVPSSFEQ
jgi:hypothetical protein